MAGAACWCWCCVLVLVLVLVLVAKKWFFTELREMGAEWRCAETGRRGRPNKREACSVAPEP
jgi:uncharacterized protein HemY